MPMPFPFSFWRPPTSGVITPTGTSFVTSTSLTTTRTDSTTNLGFKFTLSSPITIRNLGLWIPTGATPTQSHVLKLWNGAGTSLLASTTVNCLGAAAAAWKVGADVAYSAAAASYFLTFSAVNGQTTDPWYDFNTAITAFTAAGVLEGSAFGADNAIGNLNAGSGCYGPVNFWWT